MEYEVLYDLMFAICLSIIWDEVRSPQWAGTMLVGGDALATIVCDRVQIIKRNDAVGVSLPRLSCERGSPLSYGSVGPPLI